MMHLNSFAVHVDIKEFIHDAIRDCWLFGREITESYNTEIKRLAGKLLSLIAETLQLKPDFFEKMFGKPYQRMRMNYNPHEPTCRHECHYTLTAR